MVKDAVTVVLSPIGKSWQSQQARDAAYVGRLIDGLVVHAGERIRSNLFGSRPQDFTVVSTVPSGFILIQAGTKIKIAGESAATRPVLKVSYEDLGGMGRTIERVREVIEMPLRFPEVWDRLGIDPPRGVLLYGPPGCGKTLIARAVASETSAHFVHINGPESSTSSTGRARPTSARSSRMLRLTHPPSSSSTRSTLSRPSVPRCRVRSRSEWSPSCWP